MERTTESESKTEKRSNLSRRNVFSLFHPTGNLMEVSFMIHSVWKYQMLLIKCPIGELKIDTNVKLANSKSHKVNSSSDHLTERETLVS